MGKLAIKKLTASDLTLFEWQFRNKNAGNQKSINLNANVFVEKLFPSLPNTDAGREGKISIDLLLFGPGNARAYNLQRKIMKGTSYKNWRLNGEYIPNPLENADRFNVLEPGDYAIFDFEGEIFPTGARVVFVAKRQAEDAALHAGLDDIGINSMEATDVPQLGLIVRMSGTAESHPVNELLLDAAIEDASQGGLEGITRILERNSGRRLTRAELGRARQRADDVGREGEEVINGYFELERMFGSVEEYQWVSSENAIAPHDFRIKPAGQVHIKVEVKSTNGDFDQVLHLSIAQLIEMSDNSTRYDLYRVYAIDDRKAKLRIATNLHAFAMEIRNLFAGLPSGVTADGISLKPSSIPFGPEISIDLPDPPDETQAG